MFGFVGKHKCFDCDADSYRKPIRVSVVMGWCGRKEG